MKDVVLEVARFDVSKLPKAELSYCRAQLQLHYDNQAKRATLFGLLFNVCSFFIDQVVADPESREILFWAHLIFIAYIGYGLYRLRRRQPLDWFIYGGILAHVAVYAVAIHVVCFAHGVLVVKSVTTLFSMNLMFLLFSPLGGKPLTALSAALSLMMAAAVAGLPYAFNICFMHTLGMAVAIAFHFVKASWTMRIASRAFRIKTMIAPAHIVERSTGSEAEIEEIFRPARAHCVCISIHWRNFDDLAVTIPPSRLAAALGEYFELVERLLTECIKDGAYYCDAMVDEMFVVVFSPESAGDSLPLTDAVLFARRLLRERTFAKRGDLSQIDIGISTGEMLIGILGPKGHRKTTGLGETPGRAARLKSAGEMLRRERGDLDRLIIDAASHAMLTGQSGFVKLKLDLEHQVRDLNDEYLYYWEHKPTVAPPKGVAA